MRIVGGLRPSRPPAPWQRGKPRTGTPAPAPPEAVFRLAWQSPVGRPSAGSLYPQDTLSRAPTTSRRGMVLTGTEVKAAKDGKVQLKEAYASVLGNEAWLLNAHISQYSHGNRENHPPIRNRKLLLHRREIDKLLAITREKGLALIPIKIYLKNGRIKCEIAVAKGKKLHDKRETEHAKTADAEARAEMRRRA